MILHLLARMIEMPCTPPKLKVKYNRSGLPFFLKTRTQTPHSVSGSDSPNLAVCFIEELKSCFLAAAGCPGDFHFRKMCCRQVFPGADPPSFRLHVQLRPKQPLQLRPNREFWCVSPPKFGGDIGVSPGVQEGLMLISYMYHYLIRLLKKLDVFWDGFNLV